MSGSLGQGATSLDEPRPESPTQIVTVTEGMPAAFDARAMILCASSSMLASSAVVT